MKKKTTTPPRSCVTCIIALACIAAMHAIMIYERQASNSQFESPLQRMFRVTPRYRSLLSLSQKAQMNQVLVAFPRIPHTLILVAHISSHQLPKRRIAPPHVVRIQLADIFRTDARPCVIRALAGGVPIPVGGLVDHTDFFFVPCGIEECFVGHDLDRGVVIPCDILPSAVRHHLSSSASP